jgi:hypothetical protein
MQDIFHSDFNIPNDTVLVCGAGANASGNYHKVKDDWYVIACNCAIGMPVKVDAWGIADENCTKEEWFKQNHPEFTGTRLFVSDLNPLGYCNGSTYTFDSGKYISTEYPHYLPRAGVIKMGGTVAGAMIQVAYWFQPAKRIRLLGVDMFDNKYWDGIDRRKGRNQIWSRCSALNKMIQWMMENGCDIKSLSPTELDLEVVDA